MNDLVYTDMLENKNNNKKETSDDDTVPTEWKQSLDSKEGDETNTEGWKLSETVEMHDLVYTDMFENKTNNKKETSDDDTVPTGWKLNLDTKEGD